jgi:hypothetical protein
MAQSLETLRRSVLTSIYGRRAGLSNDEFFVGAKDVKVAVQDLTSASTGTALNNYGSVNISGTSLLTSAQIFLLSNPVPGVSVQINNVRANATAGTSGSTALAISRPSTAFYIESSEASTGVGIVISEGASVILTGLSTAKYIVAARSGVGVVVQPAT